jgi:hypothetical protein
MGLALLQAFSIGFGFIALVVVVLQTISKEKGDAGADTTAKCRPP